MRDRRQTCNGAQDGHTKGPLPRKFRIVIQVSQERDVLRLILSLQEDIRHDLSMPARTEDQHTHAQAPLPMNCCGVV